MSASYRLREFLGAFPTTFEYEREDTGFFVDPTRSELCFIRKNGERVATLSFRQMELDPEGAFDAWRRKMRKDDMWRPGRDGDD